MMRDPHRSEVGLEQWLSGGGVMGERVSAKIWTATALGPLERWPLSLRTALGICLASPLPACIVWGRGRLQLYNDDYSQLAVHRHSDALGADFADSWPDAWPAMQGAFERAFGGVPALVEKQRVSLDRNGVREETLATFSLAPVRDEAGEIGGLFITLIDSTAAILRSELAQANRDLEEYNYAISHDFRSPLRTLEQMSRIVVADYATQLPANAADLLKHIVRGAGTLADRAEAVSRVAQLGEQALARQRVDVVALVHEVIARLRDAVADRHIEFTVGDLPAVDADPEFLRLVLLSLLSNAVKFTGRVDHALIDVRGSRQERQNVYSVNDNGAGFDMKYAGKLFGFFQRLHTDAQFEGVGVGLALARRLIERHGGTIRAEAQEGHGATFHFTLPA